MAEEDVKAQKGWSCNTMVTMVTATIDNIYRGVMMMQSLNQRD